MGLAEGTPTYGPVVYVKDEQPNFPLSRPVHFIIQLNQIMCGRLKTQIKSSIKYSIKHTLYPLMHQIINRRSNDKIKLDVCIVWNAHNTVFSPKHSAICAQAVYFLHSTRLSVTWLNSWWWPAACYWETSASFAMLSIHIGRRRKFGEVSCTKCRGQGMTMNWFQQ